MFSKKIRLAGSTVKPIRTTPSTVRPLDPAEVAKALGAEPTPIPVPPTLSPVTFYAVRMELFKRLHSTGGRPALEGNNVRPKIPLSDQEWRQLEDLAAQIAQSTGLSPSPGQVGSALLSLALRSVAADAAANGGAGGTAALVNELGARGTS